MREKSRRHSFSSLDGIPWHNKLNQVKMKVCLFVFYLIIFFCFIRHLVFEPKFIELNSRQQMLVGKSALLKQR